MSDPTVQRLVQRVQASEWIELAAESVDPVHLAVAIEAGAVQVVRDGRGIDMVRLLPDVGSVPDDSTQAASERSTKLWQRRRRCLLAMLERVKQRHPDDADTIEALTFAVRQASQQLGLHTPG